MESIVISNKKIKHVLREFNNKDFVVQNLTMGKRSKSDEEQYQYDHTSAPGTEGPGDDEASPSQDVEPTEGNDRRLLAEDESVAVTHTEEKKIEEVVSPTEKENEEQIIKEDEEQIIKENEEQIIKENEEQIIKENTEQTENKDATNRKEGQEDGNKPEMTEEEKRMKLSEADQRAKNMAKFIDEMRASLAEYAKKEEMTEEDAKEMLKKQEELMAKLSEFEEITKHVQDLAGIENVSSALLGTPVQCREINPCGPTHFDNFPKVICFDRISQHELGVPNMIVCEPVCKEKGPCGGDKQMKSDQGRRWYAPDYDAERYIQKEISHDAHSSEVLGMLDRQGMLGQQLLQQPMRQGGPGTSPPLQAHPATPGPQMGGPGMMAWPQQNVQFSPLPLAESRGISGMPQGGTKGSPEMMGPQMQPGVMGMTPGGTGMLGAQMQIEITGPHPPGGMRVPQPGMLGAQGQIEMMGSEPLSVMIGPQGELKPMSQQGTIRQTNKDLERQPAKGEHKITVHQQEIVSVHRTKRILDDNKLITEHSETDSAKETSIEIGPFDKTDVERPNQISTFGKKDNIVDGLKEEIKILQTEMKDVLAENKDLQKRVMMCSPEATKQMLRRHRPENPVICRKTLATSPICKLDLYRQLNLPLPSPFGTNNSNKGGIVPGPHLQLPYSPLGAVGPGKCRRDLNTNKILCRRNILKQSGLPTKEEKETKDMETMVTSMEEEVKAIQAELDSIQQERRQLEMQKKLLTCTGPAVASQSGNGLTNHQYRDSGFIDTKGTQISQMSSKNIVTTDADIPHLASPLLRNLKEQYNKLQQDYQLKVEEVSMLRVELESARRESLTSVKKSEEAEARVDDLIARLKAVEDEKSKINSNKDQMIELEQQLVLAKQRYKEISEEIDEMRSQVADQTMQTEDYRKKFLTAQQNVEEQKRQIEIMKMESSRFGEQVTIELQRVKAQFQTKLEEMAPLPELLRKTQEKLKETIHLKTLAEKNCLVMSQNLEIVIEQKEKIKQQLDEINKNKNESEAEKASLKINLTDGEKKMEETKAENNKLRATVSRLEEMAATSEKKYEEKVQENLQIQSQLETLREESARQVARTKDRYENMRKSLQNQIFDLENQLAATRASAKAAQKDRDDIRQKMQAQIIQLNENFDQAQMRIRSLQSHVNYLQTSYTNIFSPQDRSDPAILLP